MSMNSKKIRMSIRVPNGLYHKFNDKVREEDKVKNRVVVKLIERYVKEPPKPTDGK